MREIRCNFCNYFLAEGDFRGVLHLLCRRCKSKNIVRSLEGSFVVTVSIDRKGDTRENKTPLAARAVVE
jgi:phage FluMu protein Com